MRLLDLIDVTEFCTFIEVRGFISDERIFKFIWSGSARDVYTNSFDEPDDIVDELKASAFKEVQHIQHTAHGMIFYV